MTCNESYFRNRDIWSIIDFIAVFIEVIYFFIAVFIKVIYLFIAVFIEVMMFIIYHESTKRKKFLLAVIYGSAR